MLTGRIIIIPFLQGKLTEEGALVEPNIDAILEKWLERHPEFRDREFHTIRAATYLSDGTATSLVRVTTDFTADLEQYDPAEDADLYEEFAAHSSDSPPPISRMIWVEQCKAAENIEAEYGTEKAMGYLIGEKLLNFLEVAEKKPEWYAQIPPFIAEIKRLFESWHIAEFVETPRRLGALGHIADDGGHEMFRKQVDEDDNLREDARNLRLLEWARELLLEDESE